MDGVCFCLFSLYVDFFVWSVVVWVFGGNLGEGLVHFC